MSNTKRLNLSKNFRIFHRIIKKSMKVSYFVIIAIFFAQVTLFRVIMDNFLILTQEFAKDALKSQMQFHKDLDFAYVKKDFSST